MTTTIYDTTPITPADPTDIRTAAAAPAPGPAVVEGRALSISSLVLGIASLAFGYTFLVPIVGLVLGILALKREPSSRAMTIWGIALSGVVLAAGVITVLFGLTLLVPLGIASVFAQ